MVLKRGENINRVLQPKKYSWFTRVLIILGIIIGLAIIYYSFLLFLFGIDDYVSSKNTAEIGKVVGISPVKMGYLIMWSNGEYSTEQFWSISSLSSIEDAEQMEQITQLKSENSSSFAEFKKEDNFNDYVISESNSGSGSSSNVLMYFSSFGNLSFSAKPNCSADFVCSDWGACYADYTLRSLFSEDAINGISYRYCKDNNQCFPDLVDSKDCSNQINITTRIQTWCNKEYLEVLDGYGRVLARVDNNKFKNYLDVSLNIDNTGYCYYCHDGKKDFDETGKDCGGSCMSCAELKKLTSAI